MSVSEPGASQDRVEPPAPGGLRNSISTAAQRIDEVVEAAERVALELREDARREAEQYIVEQRQRADRLVAERAAALSKLSDSLVRQVEDLGQQSRSLADRIDRIGEEIRGVLEEEPPLGGSRPDRAAISPGGEPAADDVPPDLTEQRDPERPEADVDVPEGFAVEDDVEVPEAVAVEEEPDESPGSQAPPSNEALLRATQMAIAGESRSAIEQQLRSEFDLENPGPVLDQVLGPTQG